jgi:hypothetical protein
VGFWNWIKNGFVTIVVHISFNFAGFFKRHRRTTIKKYNIGETMTKPDFKRRFAKIHVIKFKDEV